MTRELPREAERLRALHRFRILDTPPEDEFDDLVRLTARACSAPIAQISLIDDQRQWSKARFGTGIEELPRELSICSQAILQPGETMVVEDLATDERFANSAASASGIRFYAGTPLLTEEGLAIGTLCVLDYVPRRLDAMQEESLETLARQVTAQMKLRLKVVEAQDRIERRFRSLVHSSADGIVIIAADGTIRYASPGVERMLGIPIGEDQSAGMFDLIHPEDREAAVGAWSQVLAGGEVQAEIRFQHEDGSWPWLEIRGRNLLSDEYVNGVVVNLRDVTERRRNVTKRLQVEAQLREAEERYRTLVEHIPAVVYMAGYGSDGEWHYISPRIESLLGYSADEWLTHPSNLWVDRLHPEDRDRVLSEEEEIWHGPPSDEVFKAEYRMIAKDGSLVWVSDESVIVRDERGKPLHYLGVFVSVTAAKEAEAERQGLEEQLRQSQRMDAIGRLAGGIAHDFNNLLSIILNYSRFVASDLGPNDPRRKDIDEVTRAGERAAALVHQLLTFSRKEIVKPSVLNINTVVSHMQGMLRRTIGEHVTLTSNLAPDLASTEIDRGQMEQVLANLVVNARDAMPEGGPIRISTANENVTGAEGYGGVTPGRYVSLVVKDTGCGMTEEIVDHIFEPFFTTKARGEGTGLGLATVYGIIQRAGGDVMVSSDVGRGTSINILLPVAMNSTKQTVLEQQGADHTGRGETILVAEDEAGVRRLVKRILSGAGFNVLDAGSGTEALDVSRMHDGTVHLLLTDVVMPNMSGKDLVEGLRTTRPNARVLYMSGYTDDIVAQNGVLDAGENFIQKPFTAHALLERVRSLLDEG